MSDRRLVLAVIAALAVTACSGGPSATSTPPVGATATPGTTAPPTISPTIAPPASPTAAPPTGTPLPQPTDAEIAAWAADVCTVNATFLTDNQQITTDIPEPAERTLEALKLVNADRQPRVEQTYADAVAGLDALTPYPGGEPFREALLAEMQSALDAMPAFFQAIAAATSVEEIDAEYANRGTINSGGLLNSARSVLAMDPEFTDAVAAITSGCRFFEYDARARVRDLIDEPAFTEIAFQDSFDDDSNFETGPFGGGTTAISDGSMMISFDAAGELVVAKPAKLHDTRIETHLHLEGSLLAGVACRGSGQQRYQVVINEIGLILIYEMPGNNLLGRRVAPEGFDAGAGVDLAVECFAGNLDPFSLVVELNGERVATVTQEHAFASEGFDGMYAQALAPGATATYDDVTVLVPAE